VSSPIATALVLEHPRELVRRDFELPTIGDDDGILRIEACGLCGTDHEEYTGHLRAPYGFIPGHEAVGIVESAGDAALERWDVAIGDRVAIEVFLSCRTCPSCLDGTYRRCANHGLGDMYGFIDVEKDCGLWGGYASHLYLAPDALVLPIPETLDPVVATLFNPLGAGVRWAVEVPETKPGDVVVVLGPGIRGLSAAAAAKHAGAGFVMITGLGPRDAPRLAQAKDFGADLAVDVETDDPVRLLKKATGGLADIVVDVTAKAATAPGQALQLVRPGGTVVLAGTRGSPEVPGFDPDLIVYKEIKVVGALGVDTRSYETAINLLQSGLYPFVDLTRQTAGFDDVEALVQAMAGESSDPPPVHAVFTP
jgi:alcohol dehydrogenase